MGQTKVEMLEQSIPVILLSWKVALDIDAIVNSTKDEVGWIGEVTRNDDVYTVDKITVPVQNANGATTEITPIGVAQAVVIDQEIDHDKFRYWGHSHGSMHSVNPSDQDKTQITSFAETCDFFIGTIHNIKGDVFGYMIDRTKGLYYTHIPVYIMEHPDVEELGQKIRQLEDEIELRRQSILSEYNIGDWKDVVKKRVSVKHNSVIGYTGQTTYNKKHHTAMLAARYYDEAFDEELEKKTTTTTGKKKKVTMNAPLNKKIPVTNGNRRIRRNDTSIQEDDIFSRILGAEIAFINGKLSIDGRPTTPEEYSLILRLIDQGNINLGSILEID